MSGIGEAALATIVAELAKSLVVTILQRVQYHTNHSGSFGRDFRNLKSDFVFLSACLNDAQTKIEGGSVAFKQWAQDLNSVVMDAEDILEYCACASLGTHPSTSTHLLSFERFSRHISFQKLKTEMEKLKLKKEMQKLRQRVDKIRANTSPLQIIASYPKDVQVNGECSFSPVDNPRLSPSTLQDECFSVEMEEKIKHVLAMVERNRVVSVVGMGGIGKTRLLQHVCKKLKSTGQYEFSLWLSVSQTFTIFRLQSDILDELGENKHSKTSVPRRHDIIHERLKHKRCLVVMDDIWNLKNEEKGSYLNISKKFRALGIPEDDNCKILISTREHDVADAFGGTTYTMSFLSDKSSMELFRHHFPFDSVIHGNNASRYSCAEADTSVKDIIGRCQGLPLAVIAMAGLLQEKHPSKWKEVLQQFKDSKLETVASSAVMLSYKAMPPQHKLCFTYLALRPEDSNIPKFCTTLLWRAEGFVQSENESEEIWMQLCRRYLLQSVGSSNAKMHDIVRDFGLRILRENGGACHKGSLRKQSGENKIRRVSLETANILSIGEEEQCPASLRTLNLARNKDLDKIASRLFVNARALRVLDVHSCSRISGLPKSVANSKILKYLDISGTNIKGIPKCVENLKCLEYLRIDSAPEGIPSWVSKLQRLISLCSQQKTYWTASAEAMPCLRELIQIYITIKGDGDISDEVSGFSNLQSIALSLRCFDNEIKLWPVKRLGLENARSKKTIRQGVLNENPPLKLHYNLKSSLERLTLYSIKLPNSSSQYSGLQSLRLNHHGKGYPTDICKLPCLSFLKLGNEEEIEDLPEEYGKAGAFPKLEILRIEEMKTVKRLWPVTEDTAMPQLRFFNVDGCKELEVVPELKNEALPKLRTLQLVECPKLNEVAEGWERKACTVEDLWVRRCKGSAGETLQEARRKFMERGVP